MVQSNRLKYRLKSSTSITEFHLLIHVTLENAGPMTICALTKHQDQLMHVGLLTLHWSVIILFPSLQSDNLKLSRFTLRLGQGVNYFVFIYKYIYFLRFLSLHKIPEKQTGSQTVSDCAQSCFYQYMQITYHFAYFPSNWNIFGFFSDFSICFVSFYIFKSWILSYEFMFSKGKNFAVMSLTYNHGDRHLFCLIFLPLNMQIPFIPWISLETKMLPLISLQMLAFLGTLFTIILPCVASVSVQFRSKERGTRVKDRAKNGASKRAGRGWERKQGFNACRQTTWFWKLSTWPVSCMSSRTDIWCCHQLS